MAAALALAERGRGRTAPNPNVGCVIVKSGRVVGRGWTQPGGRPHAEAMALAQAGAESRGATCYTTLEPCAHRSERGPACTDLLIEAGVARVVVALGDPDPRTDGEGMARLRAAGIEVASGFGADQARRSMAGFLTRRALGRPHVTLKLALSLDGALAMADGRSRWITGDEARAHTHLERARHDAILVGRGTFEADTPRLDVRLPGLEDRSPHRLLLSSHQPKGMHDANSWCGSDLDLYSGWAWVGQRALSAVSVSDYLMVEGGAHTAASFLAADLVDRLLLYRAPILVGDGRTLPDIGLADLADAHRRWTLIDSRQLGSDRLEVYERARKD
ncbi:bifunctional diaminohydroxyphosphoribosylaminopyrimidine deaminase/5-amino-6-(5-phosphoribosylamino)uracil reductase RibD [Sphingomonas immobilis]